MKKLVTIIIFVIATQQSFAQILEKPVPAPDFNLTDINSKKFSLRQLKGKTVLVDFWASWCLPCRISNKKLKKLYEKYHYKNFEIVSISVDEDSIKWKRAVRKDKMLWPQLLDNRAIAESIAYHWNITSVPASFLINSSGEIIAVNLIPNEIEEILNKNNN